MSAALWTIIALSIIFFMWRSFMKNKEFACLVVDKLVIKHSIDLLDETVCLRKINIKRESARFAFYRIYSFDYNRIGSAERFRGYIVLKNGKLEEAIVSESEKADTLEKEYVAEQTVASNVNNVIKFDD